MQNTYIRLADILIQLKNSVTLNYNSLEGIYSELKSMTEEELAQYNAFRIEMNEVEKYIRRMNKPSSILKKDICFLMARNKSVESIGRLMNELAPQLSNKTLN